MRTDGQLPGCGSCGSALVQLADWMRLDSDHWWLCLHCAECAHVVDAVVHRADVEEVDRLMQAAEDAIRAEAACWAKSAMSQWVERFVRALRAGAVAPMDF
jgi:hypothetical protein